MFKDYKIIFNNKKWRVKVNKTYYIVKDHINDEDYNILIENLKTDYIDDNLLKKFPKYLFKFLKNHCNWLCDNCLSNNYKPINNPESETDLYCYKCKDYQYKISESYINN